MFCFEVANLFSELDVMFLSVVQVEKLARLNSRYVAPAGAEKPEAAGKVAIYP